MRQLGETGPGRYSAVNLTGKLDAPDLQALSLKRGAESYPKGNDLARLAEIFH